ncbi:MAG: vWA domain-containing protein [Gaiellaceae bacterium]
MLATLVFLTPRAALAGLAFLLPLAALAAREWRSARIRSDLGMPGPRRRRRLLRSLLLVLAGALVAATAAQPAIRKTSSTLVRTDAGIYLTFDVSRSMLARTRGESLDRLDRARILGQRLHQAFPAIPTGVATITNRMMPLLFPTSDVRDVPSVLANALRIMQPPPAETTGARATDLSALVLAAERTYFDPVSKKRALVVFSDADSDRFSLAAVSKELRRAHIEPFLIRVARPGERIFRASGRLEPYVSVSTLAIPDLRRAGWHAYDESQLGAAISDIRAYLGKGPTRPSGIVQTQKSYASLTALAALLLVAGLTAPSMLAALGRNRLALRRARW